VCVRRAGTAGRPVPAASRNDRTEQDEKGLHKSDPGSPSRFSPGLQISLGSALQLIKTLPPHYNFNRKKKNYLKFFWLKITILFSVADLIPSCTCPKVICGVYSPVLFPFLTFLGHFPFPGPSLAPLYPHPRCVVGTTLSLGSQPVAAGSVHPITVRAGLSPPCGCRRSGSRCGGCLCSFGGINGAFASCRDISRFLSSAELA